jgi:hypothetical protein
MINDALRTASISYCYSVPYINLDGEYYSMKTKNFADEVKKKRDTKEEDDDTDSITSMPGYGAQSKENAVIIPPTAPASAASASASASSASASPASALASPASALASPASALAAVENVQKTTEAVTLKRRRPVVAPSEEDKLAEELGEDAELQAAIAASLGK